MNHRARLLISVLTCSLTGCGGGTGSPGNPTTTTSPLSGNWQITTTSVATSATCAAAIPEQPCTLYYGVHWSVSGDSVSGNFSHEPEDIVEGVVGTVTGTTSGDTLTLAFSDPSGFTMQVTATLQTGSPPSFSGTFTSTGPSPAPATSGTIQGTLVPSLAGTWTGTIGAASVSAQLSEQGFDSFGFPNLTGTITFSDTPCFSTGTVTADQRGAFVNGPGIDGVFTQLAGLIQTDNGTVLLAYNSNGTAITTSNSSGTSINVAYLVWSGTCGGNSENGVLNR